MHVARLLEHLEHHRGAALLRSRSRIETPVGDELATAVQRRKDRNFVSAEKVNEIRTNESAAAASLRASKAAAELARLQLSYATIRAPFDGVVGARLGFPGASVKINDTTLAVVNRVRPLLVSFSVPEKYLPQLRAALGHGTATLDGLRIEVNVPQND